MKRLKIIIVILTLLEPSLVHALSIVYSFRITQITRQPIVPETENKPSSTSLLWFNYFQKTRCFGIRENYTGGLATYIRNFRKQYFFRADFAVGKAHQTIKKIETSNVIEPDDFLFTVGKNIMKTDCGRVSVAGLIGIPTHSVFTLQRVGFGNGQPGIGAQIDGLYNLSDKIDVLGGVRYNYFIPRTAFNNQDEKYTFTVGSIADFLIGLQTSNNIGHGIEGGYAARWGFGAKATPRIIVLEDASYMRNNFYLVYKYTFLTEKVAHRLLLNISYGFDSKPKDLGYNAVMVFASWGIAF